MEATSEKRQRRIQEVVEKRRVHVSRLIFSNEWVRYTLLGRCQWTLIYKLIFMVGVLQGGQVEDVCARLAAAPPPGACEGEA